MAKPRHDFLLDPHAESPITKCLKCGSTTRVRKYCLAVFLKPNHLFVLNMPCRYCSGCDLIIAKKVELDPLLRAACERYHLSIARNEYYVLGTMDRWDWRRAMNEPTAVDKVLDGVRLFKDLLDPKVKPDRWRIATEGELTGRSDPP
jgi:hypothetical protein